MDDKILISKEELEKLRAASGRLSEEVNLRKQAEEKLKTLNSDLAEYKHSEKKLCESETKFSTVFQLSPIAISITLLRNQIFLDANESFLLNVGYEREELVGQPANILDLWVDHEKKDKFRQLMVEHGKVDNYEFEFQGKKGKHGYGLVSATIIEINNEPCILSQITIITERKVIEEALMKSEESLNTAQHIAHIGSWELDIVKDILMWSDEIYRMFEIDPKKFEASYEAFLNAIHPDDRDLVNKSYTDSLEDKAPYDIVHRLQMPDGRIKYVDEKCETYYSEEGKPLRSVGTVRDITEIKLAEEAQRHLNRELRAISNCSQVLIRAGNEQELLNNICRIICNEAGYHMVWVGYVENDEAKTIRPVAWAGLDSGYIADVKLSWSDETERGRGPAGEAVRSGKIIYARDFATEPQMAPWRESTLLRGYHSGIALPIKDENAKVFGVLLIYSTEINGFIQDEIRLLEELTSDLTFGIAVLRGQIERKRAEEGIQKLNKELEQRVIDRTAKLEAANKELESLAYSLAHDLRTPLRAIDGFGQVLLEEYYDKMDEQGKDYLKRIRSAAQRIGQIIDDMLNLSRVSRSEINIQQVNLSKIVQEVADELRETQPERVVEFIIQEGIKVQGDTVLLRTVLENLMGNAWKFTSKYPAAHIEFGMQLQNNVPVYFIRDDGAGFDMNYAQKLFGAFQRLHTITEFPGTGVGLATVQRVIHRHGGKVWAEGEVEKGATIYFTIP